MECDTWCQELLSAIPAEWTVSPCTLGNLQSIKRNCHVYFFFPADLFDILLPMLNIYQEFVRNHQYSLQVLANCKQNRDFDKLLKQYEANPACEGRMLETFLTYPMFQVSYLGCILQVIGSSLIWLIPSVTSMICTSTPCGGLQHISIICHLELDPEINKFMPHILSLVCLVYVRKSGIFETNKERFFWKTAQISLYRKIPHRPLPWSLLLQRV